MQKYRKEEDTAFSQESHSTVSYSRETKVREEKKMPSDEGG